MTGITITKRRNGWESSCAGCQDRPLYLFTIATKTATMAEVCWPCLKGLAVAVAGWVDVDAACEEAGR